MIRNLGIGGGFAAGGHFAAVVIATGALLWCDGKVAAETPAILLRGYLGLFSDGLDRLAQELRARGINAEVRKHLYWTTTVSDILRERAAGKIGALILMGHSQGGTSLPMRPSLTSISPTIAGSTPMSCAKSTPCGRSIRKPYPCPGAGG